MKSWLSGLLAAACMAGNAASGNNASPLSSSPATSTGSQSAAPVGSVTVEDVLARGGRQLSAKEMKAFIPGTQWYASIVGKSYVVTNRADGSWKGEAGRLPPFQGTWRIDERGRRCSLLTARNGIAVTAEESCLFYFKIGSDYFVSNETGPSTEVVPRRLLE